MTRAILAVLALLLFAPPAEAKQRRSRRQRVAFVAFDEQGVCPATGQRQLSCPGYEVHHVVPLYCGGKDEPENMAWLTVEQHRALHRATECRRAKR